MPAIVIDSNVLLVADGKHPQASAACRARCIRRLEQIRADSCVVLDEQHLLLNEYQHRLSPGTARGAGSEFVDWLLHHQDDTRHVQWVRLNVLAENDYAEFPDEALSEVFDPSDRKFVAVANAHPEKPPILQASDCKWLDWWPQLAANGIAVEFVCPDDVLHYYRHKFPGQAVPRLPDGVACR